MNESSRTSPTIQFYKKGDEKAYITLMNLVFPRYKCNLQRWRWEFADNPFSSIQVFADFRGKIIGHMGLICVPIKMGNRIFQGSQAVDLAIHPSFRHRGIFLKIGKKLMQEAAERHIAISYGIPNEPAYRGHLKYGWFYVSEIPVLVKLMTKKSLIIFVLARLLHFVRKPCSESISKLFALMKNMKTLCSFGYDKNILPLSEYKKGVLTSFDEQIDKLWKEVSKQHSLIIARNAKYLNWRYFNKPHSKYVVLTVMRNHDIDGFVVLSVDMYPMLRLKRGYIVDLLAKSEKAIHYLLQLALEYFTKEHVDSVICWAMKRHVLHQCLLEKGFIQDHSNSEKLICRINIDDTNFKQYYLRFEKDWYFMVGDSDVI